MYRLNGAGSELPIPDPLPAHDDVPRADPDVLNAVYTIWLELLDLSVQHRAALRQRGLIDAEIDLRGYRTMPLQGRAQLACRLVERFGEATRRTVPGLYVRPGDDGRSWWTLAGAAGILIPVRDLEKRVVALKVRRDDDGGAHGDVPRYTYVSSATYGGPGPGAPVHIPLFQESASTVRVTEGELKADVATTLSCLHTISVPGVSAYRAAIPVLKALRADTVRLAFDADAAGNPHVKRALEGAATAYKVAGFRVELEMWPETDGKGIDDLLASGGTPVTTRIPEIHPAAPRDGVPAERILRFRTAREIAAETPAEVRWKVRSWAAVGAITELDGKVKSSGKTTWLTHMAGAVLKGTAFMGEPTEQSPIFYLTEQPPSSFRVALQRAGLTDRDDLVVLYWRDAAGMPWPKVVETVTKECRHRGAGMLIVDTLGQFTGLTGDAENDAGAAQAATAPLQIAAADGLAVIISRHERKSGGEVGDSGRDSSAFAGAVDIVLSLRRTEGAVRPTIREIHGLSRFDETPAQLVIELTPEGYVALGEAADVARQEAAAAILAAAPRDEGAAVPLKELLEAARVKRTIGQEVVEEFLRAGRLARLGAGKKNDPYRLWTPSSHFSETLPPQNSMPVRTAEKVASENPDKDEFSVPTIHSAGTPSLGTAERILEPSRSGNGETRSSHTPLTEADLPWVRERLG